MPDTPNDTPNPSESPGGSGGEAGYVLPGKGLKNDRLERRAVMRRWNVREDALTPMVNRQVQIAVGKAFRADGELEAVSVRESTQAFMAVLAARRQDLEIDEAENPRPAAGGTVVNVQVNQAVTAVVEQLRGLSAHELAILDAGLGLTPIEHEPHGTDHPHASPPAAQNGVKSNGVHAHGLGGGGAVNGTGLGPTP